jgi:hypothetical protein
MIIDIQNSPTKNKRYRVFIDNGKHYDFGQKDGHTFIDEGNVKKRTEYWQRHIANKKEFNLVRNLVPSPALFSAMLLWGTSTSLKENINYLNHEWKVKHGKGVVGNGAYNYLNGPTLTQRLLRTLKVFWLGRHNFLPSAQRALEQYGNLPITEMEISRHPIEGVIKVANTLTGNELDKIIKESPYDTLYHLGLFVKAGGDWIEVEKESTIKITPHKAKNPKAEILVIDPADIPQGLTMNIMLAKAQAHLKDNFFSYSSFNANCQDFVRGILWANDIKQPKYREFVMQDIQSIFDASSNPNLYRKISNIVTDAGHLGDTFMEGGKINKKKRTSPSLKSRRKIVL